MAVAAGLARLDTDLLNAYLGRLGFSDPPEPTAAALAQLHRAHLLNVPFENLDIPLGVPIVLDADAFIEKVLVRGRGGFCYELNGAFASLLAALGFDVALLEARVHSPGRLGWRFAHLCLAVQVDGRPLLADVGFGRGCFDEPIRIEPDACQHDTAGVFVLRPVEDGVFDMLCDGAEEYRLATVPRALADFAPGCVLAQSSPESPFSRGTLCTIRTPEGRATIAGSRLIETAGEEQVERELDRAAFGAELATRFGVVLGEAALDRLMHAAAATQPSAG